MLLGLAAVPKAFNQSVLKLMIQFNERPVIMALSNPTSKAECTAEEAYTYTNVSILFRIKNILIVELINCLFILNKYGNIVF